MRRLLIALAVTLTAAAPASAAEELLDTISVPANSSTIVQGTYQLKVGTRYVIEVSGTMKSVNTDGGYGHGYDALYCYEEYNVQSTSCADARQSPTNRTLRAHDVHYSTGTAEDWRLPDQFTTTSKPAGDTPAVDYDPNHTYVMGFYPPANGPIKARTYYAYTGGCPGCTNSTTGTFTVKIFGEPPAPATTPTPTPTTQPPTTTQPPSALCASAAAVLAHTAQNQPCGGTCQACKKLGTTSIMNAPIPGDAIDVGVTIDPAARQLLFDAGITDATTQHLIATLILRRKAEHLRDQFWGCVHFGLLAPDPYQAPFDYSPKNPQKLPAMVRACSQIIVEEAEKAAAKGSPGAAVASSRPIAITSQSGCKSLFYPIFKSKKESKSRKRRRQVAAAVKKAIVGNCVAEGGQLSFAFTSKQKKVPMHKLTGKKLNARLVRVAPKGTPTPPNAKMYVRWRKP